MKRQITYNINLIHTIYYILLGSFLLRTIFSSSFMISFLGISISTWGTFNQYVLPMCLIGLFVLEWLIYKLTFKQFAVTFIIIVVLAIHFMYSRNAVLIDSILFMVTIPRNVTVKDLAKVVSRFIFAGIIVVLFYYISGNLMDNTSIRASSGGLRHSYGFVSANAFANLVAVGMLINFYRKVDNWKFKNSILTWIIMVALYSVTYSRLACVTIFLIGLIGLVYKHIVNTKLEKLIYSVVKWLFSILTIFFWVIVILISRSGNSALLLFIDSLASMRGSWIVKYYTEYGPSIFGQKIEMVSVKTRLITGEAWSGLDNSYLMILIRFGIIFLVAFCLTYYFLGKQLKNNSDLIGAFITIILIVMGCTENYLYNITYNFSMYLFAYYVYYNRIGLLTPQSAAFNSPQKSLCSGFLNANFNRFSFR